MEREHAARNEHLLQSIEIDGGHGMPHILFVVRELHVRKPTVIVDDPVLRQASIFGKILQILHCLRMTLGLFSHPVAPSEIDDGSREPGEALIGRRVQKSGHVDPASSLCSDFRSGLHHTSLSTESMFREEGEELVLITNV
jgi:hypothetical protein